MSELYVDRGEEGVNKQIFDLFHANKSAIESTFGGPLEWLRLDDRRACRIVYTSTLGGLSSDESQWPAIQDSMIDSMHRLEQALKPYLARVQSEVLGK